MNTKVVIFWIVGIFVFLSIGLIGFFNRDLIVDKSIKDDALDLPKLNYDTKTCMASNDTGDITYKFQVNRDNQNIERVFVSYQGVMEDEGVYTSAANINTKINQNKIKNVNSQLYGAIKDVRLNVNVNITDFNKSDFDSLSSDLVKVGMYIDDIKNFDTYHTTINNVLGLTFECE